MPSKPWGSLASKCTTTAITRMPLPCFRAAPRATGWWPLAARTTMAVRRAPYWGISHRDMLFLTRSCLTCNGPMRPLNMGKNADVGTQEVDQPVVVSKRVQATCGNRLDTLEVALLRSLPEIIPQVWGLTSWYVSPFDPGHTCTSGV